MSNINKLKYMVLLDIDKCLRKIINQGRGLYRWPGKSFWKDNLWVKTQQKVRKIIPATAKALRWENVLCSHRTARTPIWLEGLVSKGKKKTAKTEFRGEYERGQDQTIVGLVAHDNDSHWMRQKATEEQQAQMWHNLIRSLKGSLLC